MDLRRMLDAASNSETEQMNIEADIRNLAKWLNEEQTAPIDRQALARLLAWAQMADKPAAWVYPEFFEGIANAGCWTAYAGDGSAAADGVKRIPLYRGALTGGDERRHIICLCPDCTKPAQKQELCPSCRNGSIYACTCTFKPAQQQEPVLCINPKVIDPATGKVRNGTGALTYSDTPCAGWSFPLYTSPQKAQQEPVAWINAVMEQAQVFASAWSLVGGRFDDGSGMETAEQEKAALRAMLTSPPASKPFSFPQEAAAFKAWFDAWYVGDGEQGETIPGQSDPHFLTYVDQYTLGFGAWMAAKHAARAGT